MFCKECGTENLDINEIKCKSCNMVFNSNLPLDGTERIKIIISSLLFLIPILWIAGIIIIASFYIMIKDKSFTPILNAQKYIRIYFIASMYIGITIITIWFIIELFSYYGISLEELMAVFAIVVGIVVIGKILIFIYDNLFFRTLLDHKDWIVNNGLFADKKSSKKNSINVVGRDNLSSYSVADEILKWNSLLEKKLITQEEFQKAKERILNGKLD